METSWEKLEPGVARDQVWQGSTESRRTQEAVERHHRTNRSRKRNVAMLFRPTARDPCDVFERKCLPRPKVLRGIELVESEGVSRIKVTETSDEC